MGVLRMAWSTRLSYLGSRRAVLERAERWTEGRERIRWQGLPQSSQGIWVGMAEMGARVVLTSPQDWQRYS